jgi:ATP-dependent helicase/nuclease subunit A
MAAGNEEQAVTSTAPRRRNVLTQAQKDASDPNRSVWVAASAGSGKTHVLSTRILRLLLDGVDPQSILCLTYTKAAATEMATRLFTQLSGWIALDDSALREELKNLGVAKPDVKLCRKARQLFATALETPGGLKIQTIHAFCESLLQLFPVEAGIAPGFRVMEEDEQRKLLRDSLAQALLSPKPDVAAAWDALAGGGLRNAEQLESLARGYLSKGAGAIELLDAGGIRLLQGRLEAGLGLRERRSAAEFEREICAIDEEAYLRWASSLESAAEYRDKDEEPGRLRQTTRSEGHDRFLALLPLYFTAKGQPLKAPIRKKLAQSAGIAHEIQAEQARVADLFDQLNLRKTADASLAAAIAMAEVNHLIEAAKRARGLYDFDDLIVRTAALLGNSENAQWVLYKLDKGLNHILVDEAQDTNPAQWRIITALAEEFFSGKGQREEAGRSVFAVGDRKQSIFSFQGADLSSFDETRGWLEEKAKPLGGLLGVGLTVSYRSLGHVLSSVDMVFAEGRAARQGFGEKGQDERKHEAERKGFPGVFEFWPLVTREEDEDPDYWKAPVDHIAEDHPRRKLARKIAQTVKSWIDRRQLQGSERAVSAGDVLILVQRRNLLFSALIAEMRQLGIAVAGADRLELGAHIIVQDLLALAQAMVLPGDDHTLACLFKSPLMPQPLDDAALTGIAAKRGAATLRERLFNDPQQMENAQALQDYEKLARQCGPFEFFSRIVQKHMIAILTRLGSEAEDAARAFLDLALDYEREEGLSLSGFANWMKGSDTTIKREMEEAQGRLRIMTVHGSKGLEAPIVILADAGDVPRNTDKTKLLWPPSHSGLEGMPIFLPDLEGTPELISQWKDHDKQKRFEENMRLLYVGMTRAADELYVCGSFNKTMPGEKSWWNLLEEAITGETELEFRDHALIDGTMARRLGPDDVPLKGAEGADPVLPPLPDWLYAPVLQRASIPQRTISPSGDAIHLAAARRGIAIHGLLEKMPEWPASERRERAMKRAKRHSLEESLVKQLLAIVEGPETSVFYGPGSRAEVDLSGVLASGETVVGRIDRLARDNETFLILDYKSGERPPGPLAPEHDYVRQLAGYAALLRETHPGHRVKAALLWTQSGDLQWIPQDLLQSAHGNVAWLAS